MRQTNWTSKWFQWKPLIGLADSFERWLVVIDAWKRLRRLLLAPSPLCMDRGEGVSSRQSPFPDIRELSMIPWEVHSAELA